MKSMRMKGMKIKQFLLIALTTMTIISFTSCKLSQDEKTTQTVMKEEEDTAQGAQRVIDVEGESTNEVSFPETYYRKEGDIVIACELDFSEDFQPDALYVTQVKGKHILDEDVVTTFFGGGKTIEKEMNEKDMGYKGFCKWYTDGSYLGMPGEATTFSYLLKDANWYMAMSVTRAMHQSSGELTRLDYQMSEEQVLDVVSELGLSDKEFHFHWYSMDQEALKDWQDMALAGNSGFAMKPEFFRDAITEEDEIIVFYSWQYQQGLPVLDESRQRGYLHLPQDMFDCGVRHVQAIFSGRGLEFFYLTPLYDFQDTEEKLSLLDFEDIANVVCEKYKDMGEGGTEPVYTFSNATLFQRIWTDRKCKLQAQPAWRFVGSKSDGSNIVVLIDAVTGKEIAL